MGCALGNGTAPTSFWELAGVFFLLIKWIRCFLAKVFFHNKRLHNAFEIGAVQSCFEKTSLDALWGAGGVLRGGVVNGDGLVDAMGSMVFFFGPVSVADGGFVAGGSWR